MQVPFIVENNNNYSCEQTLNYKTRNHREGRGVQETPWYNAISGARAGRGQGAGTLRARRGSARRSRGPLPGAHSQLLRSVSASRFLARLRS